MPTFIVRIEVYPYTGTPITPGLPLTLSIRTENDAAPLVQWRKNGQPIAGATGLNFNLARLRESDTGVYDAILTNAFGIRAATEFPLVVRAGTPLPRYTPLNEDVIVPAGLIAGLPTPGPAAFGFVRGWQLNGQWLPPGTLGHTYQIPNVSAKDEGIYRYVVSNGIESVVAAERTLRVRPNLNVPFVILQPRDIWFNENGGSSFGTTGPVVEGAMPLTYQWRRNGVDVPGSTISILNVTGFLPAQAGSYTCVARNTYGSVETKPIEVSYRLTHVPPEKPRIRHYAATSPLVVGVDDPNKIELESSNFDLSSPTSIAWRHNGLPLNDSSSTLRIFNVTSAHAGFYTVIYGNRYGTTESDPFEVRVIDATQPPYLSRPKLALTPRLGETVYLSSPFIARGATTYRWFLNGRDVTSEFADSARGSISIASAQLIHVGLWSVEITHATGTRMAPVADLTLDPGPPASAHLINLSTRATAGQGAATLIVGFGLGGTAPKRMLLRAIGPRLGAFGIASTVRNPRLTVYRGDTIVATNEDWSRQSGIASLIAATQEAGAFALGLGEADAALTATLPPGSYTMQYVSDAPGADAVGLIEAYDLDPGYAPTRLTNLSSRLFVGPGEQAAIPGLTVRGSGAKTYLVRAIGPGLAKFGVTSVLTDPKIALTARDGARATFSNDDWASAPNRNALEEAAKQVGAFALDSTSKDAALLVALPAGSYTALVSGANNTAGIVLIEVYEIP